MPLKTKQEQLAEDVAKLVDAGKEWHHLLVEMTQPNLPTSRLQQYRLTDKGRRLLETLATRRKVRELAQ